jgi:alpha-glucosidase
MTPPSAPGALRTAEHPVTETAQPPWWRGAVLYQIYPRSFMDSDGDGVGDLRGIIQKLDYVRRLGVDGIWISPFFKSPMKDFGYDVSDYRAIDPLFGNHDDFSELIHKAHESGLRIIVDQVLSHTSDEHEWFAESRSSRDNPKADWYVWADPQEDGSPPNNWLSIFGGSAWQWESRREQYYLHNFLSSQPDLNFHCADVQQRMLEEVEFWLKRGVDGLRLDAVNFCFHDAQLRDNPPKPARERRGRGFRTDNPYAYQRHIYDNTRPENLEFMEKLRALIDEYPGVVTLGEISAEDTMQAMADYTSGDKRLHLAYNFELLVDDFSVEHIRDAVESLEAIEGDCWPCWSTGNHDVRRVVSRWAADQNHDAMAKLFNAFLLSLRGTVCTYEGEELGLTEVDIAPEQVQDPYGINFWPMFKGRDGCRTPMPWQNDDANAGFSTRAPWLPIPKEHRARAVEVQESDPSSVLNAFRQFVEWRGNQPCLMHGTIQFIEAPASALCFVRELDGERLLCTFNFGTQPVQIDLPQDWQLRALDGHGLTGASVSQNRLTLAPAGACFMQVRSG